MDIDKFNQVNKAIAGRLSISLVANLLLILVVLVQALYISNRQETIIDRPLLYPEKPITMVRDQATRDVRELWAMNLANLIGNMSPQTYSYIEAVTYSILSPQVRESVMPRHREELAKMEEARVDVHFVAKPKLVYDPKSGYVRVEGERIVYSLVNKDARPERVPYFYAIKVDVDGYKPVVTGWDEGELR